MINYFVRNFNIRAYSIYIYIVHSLYRNPIYSIVVAFPCLSNKMLRNILNSEYILCRQNMYLVKVFVFISYLFLIGPVFNVFIIFEKVCILEIHLYLMFTYLYYFICKIHDRHSNQY